MKCLEDLLIGGLLCRWNLVIGPVVDAINMDRNVIVVEQVDDLGVGERTRSHGRGAPSATLQSEGVRAVGRAAIGEEEDGTAVGPGQAESVANVLGPANVVQPPLARAGLPRVHELVHAGRQSAVVSRWFSPEEGSSAGHSDASQYDRQRERGTDVQLDWPHSSSHPFCGSEPSSRWQAHSA